MNAGFIKQFKISAIIIYLAVVVAAEELVVSRWE